MSGSLCIIQGHPDGSEKHLCHAIADAYASGARKSGAIVHTIDLGNMDIPMLRRPIDFASQPNEQIVSAQRAVSAAEHLLIVFPLWLGTMPALVKSFFEQLSRNGFAIQANAKSAWPRQMLKGKTARVVVPMGMPAFAYRWMFGAHGVRAFQKSILEMSGIKPARVTYVGGVGGLNDAKTQHLLAKMELLGKAMR